MRQRLVAGVLVVAVPVAAVIALFAHAHPDDHDTDHHQAHGIHAHFGGHGHHSEHAAAAADDDHHHGPGLSEREDGHDRAVFVRAFLSATISSFTIVAALPLAIELAPPAERPLRRTLQVAHGHDPPAIASLPARAPPRLPVLI